MHAVMLDALLEGETEPVPEALPPVAVRVPVAA
jgi:hypothetical protein